MTTSQPWQWSKVEDTFWDKPSPEIFPIIERWQEKKYSSVLDLGCGTGRHSVFLATLGFSVSAFDLAEDGIDKLRSKVHDSDLNISIQVGDMLNLPYEPESFDCILSMFTVQHTDMKGLKIILKNIYTALKPTGEAFITLTSKKSDAWEKHRDSRIDDNTLIKTEGSEVNVPHTYLNYDEVIGHLNDFNILKIQEIITYLPKQEKKHAHFYCLLSKKV